MIRQYPKSPPQIPQSAWSALSKNLLPYIPESNREGNIFSTSAFDQTLRDDKGVLKIDHNSRWGSFSGYYFADDYLLDDPYPTG